MTTPQVLGERYRIGGVLGRGGMAEVHRGRDMRLNRDVAVKVLRSDLATEPQVATAVHLGHAAPAQDATDLVALTEHLRRGHRRSSRAGRCIVRARASASEREPR